MRSSLLVLLSLVALLLSPRHAAAAGTQDDRPPLGRSLFDALTMREVAPGVFEQRVPYPFPELRRLIEQQSEAPGIVTLIPKGRSLQRNASSDPFHFPRVVLAVTADPPADRRSQLLLRDRLFLAYVEDAAQLEVISFNPRAGRFEFQQVDNYAAGQTPRVRYANRDFCQGCHQNEGPLFSSPPWQETVANPEIAARVLNSRVSERYLGIPIRQSTAQPQQIDNASDRANILTSYQRLWREGCRLPSDEESRHCRRLVIDLLLGYIWDGALPAEKEEALRVLTQRAWEQNLGAALKLVSPDIPNFFSETTVPAAFDPLSDRRAKAWQLWQWASESLRVVFGLLENLSSRDIVWLEEHRSPEERERLSRRLDSWELTAESPLQELAFDRCHWFLPLVMPGVSDPLPACAPYENAAWPAPQTLLSVPTVGSQGLELFQKHCGRCHQSGPFAFLKGGSESEILDKLQAGAPRYRQRLQWEAAAAGTMPPLGTAERQELEAHPEERSRMLELLNALRP